MITILKEIKKRGRKPAAKKVVQEQADKIAFSLEAIEKKAYELFEQRGGQHGSDLQDWFEAEKLLGG